MTALRAIASSPPPLKCPEDVVDAVAQGQSHVHAVGHVDDAIQLLTGRAGGEPGRWKVSFRLVRRRGRPSTGGSSRLGTLARCMHLYR